MKRIVLTACAALTGLLSAPARNSEALRTPDVPARSAETRTMSGDTVRCWTLDECLHYALENNIQLRQSRNDYLSGLEDTKEAKAAMLPSLTASTTQGFTNYPSTNVSDRNTYTGTYGIDAGLTLYEGGKLRTAVKQQQVQNRIDELSVAEAENDIRIAIVQAYMQALYAVEAVTVADNTAADTTDGCDLVADLCFFTHFVFFLSLLGLRTEEDEIQCAEQQSIHENHHNDSAGVSAGLGQKKILIHIVFYTSNRIFQL